MGRYAETTKVPVARSKQQIVDLISGRGASDYMMGSIKGRDFIAFMYESMQVRLSVPPYDASDEREHRRAWRVMLLWVKAQFEAIDGGILEAYGAFLPYLQLPDGRTIQEAAAQDGVKQVLGQTLALPAPEAAQ